MLKALILLSLAIPVLAGPLSSDGPPIAPSQSIPKEPPLTAVMVVQCDFVIGMFATMPTGELLLFNMKSGVDYEKVIQWGESAKHHATAESQCVSTL